MEKNLFKTKYWILSLQLMHNILCIVSFLSFLIPNGTTKNDRSQRIFYQAAQLKPCLDFTFTIKHPNFRPFVNLQHCVFTYPLSDFWQSSNCSNKWGNNWLRVSSPTQHSMTFVDSWALVIIFTQDLSMFWNLLAS